MPDLGSFFKLKDIFDVIAFFCLPPLLLQNYSAHNCKWLSVFSSSVCLPADQLFCFFIQKIVFVEDLAAIALVFEEELFLEKSFQFL